MKFEIITGGAKAGGQELHLHQHNILFQAKSTKNAILPAAENSEVIMHAAQMPFQCGAVLLGGFVGRRIDEEIAEFAINSTINFIREGAERYASIECSFVEPPSIYYPGHEKIFKAMLKAGFKEINRFKSIKYRHNVIELIYNISPVVASG